MGLHRADRYLGLSRDHPHRRSCRQAPRGACARVTCGSNLLVGDGSKAGKARPVKGKAEETAAVATKDGGQRTKGTRRKHVEHEGQGDAAHGRGMTMVDPWSMLLEQFLVEPTDDGGAEDRPAARAQPEAGAAVKPKRTKKGKGGDEHC